MSDPVDKPRQRIPEGMVSEGGVDAATGSTTGALAGAILGAAGGPLGLLAGAAIGGAIGSAAFAGKERPAEPDPFYREQGLQFGDDNPLTDFDRDKPPARDQET